ncbi:MAG: DUF6883 domain-containing protein, partial [Patescibacteria group bacterium]
IAGTKLLKYLLSETHVIGKFKAKYFRSLGYTELNVELLEKTLRKIAQSKNVDEKISSPFGTKYLIGAVINTPKSTKVKIQTIWILEPNQKYPRFVTAYPV